MQEFATGPNEQKEPIGEGIKEPGRAEEAVEHSEQPEPPGSGMILVSRQPIGLLASPSPSASVLYGFPAGRPFRVIGHDGGFAHIQDLKSSASGWIDEAALEGSRAFRLPRLILSRSLIQLAASLLETHGRVRSQKLPRTTAHPLPEPVRSQKPPRTTVQPLPSRIGGNQGIVVIEIVHPTNQSWRSPVRVATLQVRCVERE